MQYRILKDINYPGYHVKAGTVSDPIIKDGIVFFKTSDPAPTSKCLAFSEGHIIRNKEWFEKIEPSLKDRFDNNQIDWEKEYRKCIESPYYFANSYMMITGNVIEINVPND